MKDLKFRSWVGTFVFCAMLSLQWGGEAYAREFPPLSKVGTLNGFERPFAKIGSKTFQLAPGALIRDQSNRIIVPTIIPVGAKVVYKIEVQTGLLHEMWLLAPDEVVTIRQ